MPRALYDGALDVSRETLARHAVSGEKHALLKSLPVEAQQRLEIYAEMLGKWQKTINLIAPSTLPYLWSRHIGDSVQVQAVAPDARLWVDLGSGGGFPGLVTAILLAERGDAHVHLVESDKRKASFLQAVSRETNIKTTVHAMRIEDFCQKIQIEPDAVSARALAPLPKLLDLAEPLLRRGAVGVFPKGQTAEAELTTLTAPHRFVITSQPSRTDPAARLYLIRMPQPIDAVADV